MPDQPDLLDALQAFCIALKPHKPNPEVTFRERTYDYFILKLSRFATNEDFKIIVDGRKEPLYCWDEANDMLIGNGVSAKAALDIYDEIAGEMIKESKDNFERAMNDNELNRVTESFTALAGAIAKVREACNLVRGEMSQDYVYKRGLHQSPEAVIVHNNTLGQQATAA